MADAPETGTDTGTETDPPNTETSTQDRLPDDHPAAQALKKANEEAAKLRAKVKEFEDADKSELEKATTAAAEAAKRAEEAEMRALRLEVATEKGLDARGLRYLTGATREELEANADQILEDFPSDSRPPPKLPARPKPAGGTNGSKSSDDPSQLEGKERAAAALRQFRNT